MGVFWLTVVVQRYGAVQAAEIPASATTTSSCSHSSSYWTSIAGGTFNSQNCAAPHPNHNVFGVSHRLPSLLSVRGGAVLEATTLEDLDAIVTNAALQGKLVVLDFGATWCGPCKMIAPLVRFHHVLWMVAAVGSIEY